MTIYQNQFRAIMRKYIGQKRYGDKEIPDNVEDLFLTFWLDEREAMVVEE